MWFMPIIRDKQGLRNHEAKIRVVYNDMGISGAKNYIYVNFRIKMSKKEIREFLNVPGYDHGFAMEVKRLAWQVCGWPAKGGNSKPAGVLFI